LKTIGINLTLIWAEMAIVCQTFCNDAGTKNSKLFVSAGVCSEN